jgi:hypothetical protein
LILFASQCDPNQLLLPAEDNPKLPKLLGKL